MSEDRLASFRMHRYTDHSVGRTAAKYAPIAWHIRAIAAYVEMGDIVIRRDLFLWQFAGFSLSTLAGTLLHFCYDWSGESVWIAPISGVNESTWEHMKLLFVPLFAWAILQSRFFKEHSSFWCIKLVGITVGLVLIPVLFYTYNGAFGRSPDWLNITIYFVSAAGAFGTEWWLLGRARPSSCRPRMAVAALCIIGILFVVWTFWPPAIPLFCDPITSDYGIT